MCEPCKNSFTRVVHKPFENLIRKGRKKKKQIKVKHHQKYPNLK